MLAAQAGDRDALAALYDRHSRVLLAIARRLLGSRAEGEDLLQDVFIEAWQRARDYDPRRGSVKSWLAMRIRSRALDRLKSAAYAKMSSIARLEECEDALSAPDGSDVTESARIGAFVASLPNDQRIVVDSVYRQGKTLTETARECGVPTGTVKSRLARALRALRSPLLDARRRDDGLLADAR